MNIGLKWGKDSTFTIWFYLSEHNHHGLHDHDRRSHNGGYEHYIDIHHHAHGIPIAHHIDYGDHQAGYYGGHNGEHYGAHVEEHYGPSDKSYGYKDGAYRHKIGRHGFHEGNHYDDVGSQKGKNEKSSEKYFAHVLWKVGYLKVPLYKI